MKGQKKKQSGITLIALVITIIVLFSNGFFAPVCGNNNGIILSCESSGNITSDYESNILGGICGVNTSTSTLQKCLSYTNISGKSIQCGGIIGQNQAKIKECANFGNISATSSNHLGGIVGVSSSEPEIIACYNKGNITVTGKSNNVGGIVGQQNSGNIIDCYNLGDINLNNITTPVGVGGITGLPSMSWVYGVYNLGNITAQGCTPTIGGVVNIHSQRSVKGLYNEGEIISDNYDNVGAISGATVENMFGLTNIFYYCSLTRAFAINSPEERSEYKLSTPIDKTTLLNILESSYSGTNWKADTENINNQYPILSWQ